MEERTSTPEQEWWPCQIERLGGESIVSFSAWTKGLLPLIVDVLVLEHPDEVIDGSQPVPDGRLLVVQASPSNIVNGEIWQDIIRAHVQQQESDLEKHLGWDSTYIHFAASSHRITYVRRLARMIHALMQDPARIHEVLRMLGRNEVLRMIPVRNLPFPGDTIGVTYPPH